MGVYGVKSSGSDTKVEKAIVVGRKKGNVYRKEEIEEEFEGMTYARKRDKGYKQR